MLISQAANNTEETKTTRPDAPPVTGEAVSYKQFFIRGEKRLTADQAKLYTTSIPMRGRNSEDVRLNNLYRDCFAIHVTDYFGASASSLNISNQEDRIIAADNITARFLTKHYNAPVIQSARELDSAPHGKDAGVDLETFIRRISTNPIDGCTKDSDEMGTNKVTYLIGDVGIGKSTLIAKIHMQCVRGVRDADGYRTVPIVYDFETRHRDGERLKPIGDEFWADLYTHIYQVLASRTEIKDEAQLDIVAINPKISDTVYHSFLIHHLRQLIHHLNP